MQHKYSLSRERKKYNCPQCNKKTYVRFVNYKNEHLPEKYGRCDREDRCGYFVSPYHDGFGTGNIDKDFIYIKRLPEVEVKPDFINKETMQRSLTGYGQNNLAKYLLSVFGENCIDYLKHYNVGCYENYSIFWNVDTNGNVRSGKYMKYGENGRRDKESFTSWEHVKKSMGQPVYPGYSFVQCFFGEHLLKTEYKKPVAIVESEKTALICRMVIDKYVWLASGSKNGLGYKKCEVLKNRSVTLFPDLGAYDEWNKKAKELNFNISDHIEKIATPEHRESGLDLADYILQTTK